MKQFKITFALGEEYNKLFIAMNNLSMMSTHTENMHDAISKVQHWWQYSSDSYELRMVNSESRVYIVRIDSKYKNPKMSSMELFEALINDKSLEEIHSVFILDALIKGLKINAKWEAMDGEGYDLDLKCVKDYVKMMQSK